MGRKKSLLALTLILSLLMTAFFISPVFGKNLAEINSEKNANKAKRVNLESKLMDKEKELTKLEDRAKTKKKEVEEAQAQTESIQADIDETEHKLDVQKENLGKRLRAMYKNGSVGFLDVVLSSRSISEFLSNVAMLQKIYKNDQQALDEIEATRNSLQSKKNKLKVAENSLEGSLTELASAKNAAEKQKASMENDLAALEKEYAQMERDSEAITAQILAYEQQSQVTPQQPGSNGGTSPGSTYTPPTTGTGRFMWPVSGYVTSEYGPRTFMGMYFHSGIDIAAPLNTPIHAADSGTVISATTGWGGGYGNHVVISHGNSFSTLYGHMTSFIVSAGQSVTKGQVIGYVGLSLIHI